MNRHEFRQLQLAGTVTFPATFPQVARISLQRQTLPYQSQICGSELEFILAKEFPSARVTISRLVQASKVRALFIPKNPNQVSFEDGCWYLDSEVADHLRAVCKTVTGIIYVAETEPTLLRVSAGMTAAESAQYYPPLPCDRSQNHYACHPKKRSTRFVVSCDEMENDDDDEVGMNTFQRELGSFGVSCDEDCPPTRGDYDLH